MPAQRVKTGFQALGALAVTLTLLLSGCSGSSNSNARAGLMDVEVGMSESQVLAIMSFW
jgi:hypothetical protein